MKTGSTEASPAKALLRELEGFQCLCHASMNTVLARMDERVATVKARVEALGAGSKIPNAKNHDIRDMLTLLGHAAVHPEKARRKDLKKLDSITDDLIEIAERWKKN
jgi:hypothetical protein